MVPGEGRETLEDEGVRGSIEMVRTLEAADAVHCKTLSMEQVCGSGGQPGQS